MKLESKLWVLTLALLMITFIIPKGTAQPWATIYPSQGSVFTDIYLQVRGLGGELYLFWDDILLGTYLENFYDDWTHKTRGFDVHFNPPNWHPYSDLGNHTVFLMVWWTHYNGMDYHVQENFTLTFEIIEYFPCEEYISLNVTYHELLNGYNSLLADYNALSADYNELLDDHNSLSDNYNNLLGNYSALATNFDSLNSSYYELEETYESLDSTYSELLNTYSGLQTGYDNLQEDYDALTSSYDGLQTSYNALTTNYNSLQISYNALQTNHNNLQEDYHILIDDLLTTKNLNYVFIAITMILIATTVYFAVRKPRTKENK